MNKPLTMLLSFVAACGMVPSAYSLTIVPTFDGSITNDPNGAAMTNAIYAAIRVEQSNFVDNVTVKIHFTNDVSVGLGQSSSWGNSYSYSTFLTALKNSATSRNDNNSLSKIPDTTTDPLIGRGHIYVNKAPARLLGLTSSYGPDGYDSTIMLNMTLMNFSRPPLDPDKYDIEQVSEHEMDEVMGVSSDLPDFTIISPIDLFRFTTNLVRTYTTNGDDAYFSVDGTNLLARFNMNPGGDYSDWYSYNTLWAPLGATPVPQVQDAFSLPGYALDLGSNELAMLDVVGWTVAVTAPASAPVLNIVRTAVNQFTLSWANTANGFVLQENTNLLTASTWVASATGPTNPAVITSTTARKFYRLYKAATPSLAQTQAKIIVPDLSTSPDQLRVHINRPSRH